MTKKDVERELKIFATKVSTLPPGEALQAIEICSKVVAGFRLKDSVNRITVVDLVKTMAKLSG